MGVQQPGGVSNAGAVDFRQNKRAGQGVEQVMRAYGVKGMDGGAGGMAAGMGGGMSVGAGAGQPKQLMGMAAGGQQGMVAGVGAGNYGSHPNRHYAPAKR